ncbi:MAG: hypothetical protein GY811_29930 [Myxococcales bacterium]|nr:hypothetical protein [Myxococcales bacterium]
MGRPEATEQYLRLFRAEQRERFAFVVLTPAALTDSSNAVVADLDFLRELELIPVVCIDNSDHARALVAKLEGDFPIRECQIEDAATLAAEGTMPLIIAASESERRIAIARLRPRKVVFLIGQSGLQPEGQAVRSLINMRTDYASLVGTTGLRTEQASLLSEVRELFTASEHTFSVSLTSPQDLLRELFTVKGAGTLVRRGARVERLRSYEELEHGRFSTLLESAFGRAPTEAFFERAPLAVYLSSDYQGAAVMEPAPLAPYLSKFAVDIRAQGEGIGGDLWHALAADHDRFFWRSRPDNPIAPWYGNQCDGLVRCDGWTVFWRGLATSEIVEAVTYAHDAPIDLGQAS